MVASAMKYQVHWESSSEYAVNAMFGSQGQLREQHKMSIDNHLSLETPYVPSRISQEALETS